MEKVEELREGEESKDRRGRGASRGSGQESKAKREWGEDTVWGEQGEIEGRKQREELLMNELAWAATAASGQGKEGRSGQGKKGR